MILVIGIFAISICSFLPIIQACNDVDTNGDVTYLYIKGFESFEYYTCLIFPAIIFFLSLLPFEKSYIFMTVTLIILMVLTLIVYRFLSIAGWGRPCGSTPYYFYILMIFGSSLIIISSFISMNRKKNDLIKSIDDL